MYTNIELYIVTGTFVINLDIVTGTFGQGMGELSLTQVMESNLKERRDLIQKWTRKRTIIE